MIVVTLKASICLFKNTDEKEKKKKWKVSCKVFCVTPKRKRKTIQSISMFFESHANAKMYLPNIPKNLGRENHFNGRNFVTLNYVNEPLQN